MSAKTDEPVRARFDEHADHGRQRIADWTIEARPEERVDRDVGLFERLDELLQRSTEREAIDATADSEECVVVRSAIGRELRVIAGKPCLDACAAREEMPRDDEAVAAVVSGPAHDQDA